MSTVKNATIELLAMALYKESAAPSKSWLKLSEENRDLWRAMARGEAQIRDAAFELDKTQHLPGGKQPSVRAGFV